MSLFAPFIFKIQFGKIYNNRILCRVLVFRSRIYVQFGQTFVRQCNCGATAHHTLYRVGDQFFRFFTAHLTQGAFLGAAGPQRMPKEFGFINNRIYDATAAGAMVISDYMPEIEAEYGDTIPMYKNKEELRKLLNYYLSHEEERQRRAEQARGITLHKFTNTAVAATLSTACEE